ncbi:MAG: hypothetical protein CMJ58_22890 [Planctomycetaceae bacterium]|nr:hypothetical protein [Planctomycetaceae bacterium]
MKTPRALAAIVTAILALGAYAATCSAMDPELIYDFETDDQHREIGGSSSSPGWGGFGAITTDRGPTSDASAGDQARFHVGDFGLPYDLPGNWGIVDVSDRNLGFRKDFSAYSGLQLDMKFLSDESLPYTGPMEVSVGFGFIVPGIGEDESLTVYADPITLTDEYATYSVMFTDIPFIQTGATLANDMANNAFIKMRISNTEFNDGIGKLYYDEVYGLFGGAAADNADFDGSTLVDGSDLMIWQRGFNLTGQVDNSMGDADNSGVVDGADLAVWQTQYGTNPAVAALVGAVPEPSSIALVIASLVGGCAAWRAQRNGRVEPQTVR